MIRVALALSLLLAAAPPLSAQVGVRGSTASREADETPIVVQGNKKSLAQSLRALIKPENGKQFARFEDAICPMVIGMPRDWTGPMTRMIRDNIAAAGGKLEPVGCRPTALAIFIDQPRELVDAMHDEMPGFFAMTPREYDRFLGQAGPVWSWHVSEMTSRDGAKLASGSMGGNDFSVVKSASATRLYTNVRHEMLAGFFVMDRQRTVGKTLRQLADLATMHLMLNINPRAVGQNMGSILSLYEGRPEGAPLPAMMSDFDRGALRGLYVQKENNRSAIQQSENIAREIRKQGDE